MLKFVRLITVVYLLTGLYVIPSNIIALSGTDIQFFPDFIFFILDHLFLITTILIAPISLILLFKNEKYSPNFDFKRKERAIFSHLIFIICLLFHSIGFFFLIITFIVGNTQDIPIVSLQINEILRLFLFFIPLINFFSIFKNRFTITKEPSESE